MSDVKQNAIPYTKERCLKAAIVELVADHETLKREVNELREHNSYLETRVSEESDYATLLASHNALVEAVKKYFKSERLEILKREARAAVDRLIASESAANCEGEG